MKTDIEFRYPGSRPFGDTNLDRLLFYGRKEESRSLLHMILAENLVVLFAKSGIGKTSLLNAGVMKELRARDFIPFMIRLSTPAVDTITSSQNDRSTDPLQPIYHTIDETIKKYNLECTPGEKNTLWEYFKTAEFWSSHDILLTPILILDQFEELFTLHSSEGRKSFIAQLADVVRGRLPEKLLDSLQQGEQFSYSEKPPRVKVIISIREDFLGQLEEMSQQIPEILSNRFRLLPLSRDQATQAIEEPAKVEGDKLHTKPFSYASDAVEEMLDFLCTHRVRNQEIISDEVDPNQLQLLCQHIENTVRLKQSGKPDGKVEVQKEDLGGKPGMERVLQNFYDDQINRLRFRWKKKRVRNLCEKGLISASDRRLSLDVEVIDRNYKVKQDLLVQLVNGRLLRSEPRLNSVYYELSHDTLVEPIRTSQKKRKAKTRNRIVIGGILVCVFLYYFIPYIYPKIKTELKIRSLRSEPNKIYAAQGYNDLAYEFLQKKDYTNAIEIYEKAIDSDPGLAHAYVSMAAAYFQQKKYDEAMVNCEEAIKINPKIADAYVLMAAIYHSQLDYEEAYKLCEKALKLRMDDQILATCAEVSLTAERFEKALDLAENALTGNLEKYEELAMRLISVSSLLLKDEQEKRCDSSSISRMEGLVNEYKSLDSYDPGSWEYRALRDFISKSEQLDEADKKVVLGLITVLESKKPEGDKKLKELVEPSLESRCPQ